MTGIRGVSRPVQFALATALLSAAAWLAIILCGLADRNPLDYRIFDRLFIFTDNWGAALEILIVLLVCFSPRMRRAGAQLAVLLGERPRSTAAITAVVLAIAARTVYYATPFAMDEYAQLAQANAFAQGAWSWITPPDWIDRMIPPGFRNYFLAVDPTSGQTASMYWPGFAALLTPFVWTGVPWLLNPLLSAATLLLLHALGVRLLGTRAAGGWAMLLALASPEFTVSGISFYSMTAHLAANLSFVWLLVDGRPSRAFVAGLLGGWALILHNPVPHLLFVAPWILWLLLDRDRWPAFAALTAGYLPIGAGVGVAWPLCLARLTPHVGTATEPLMQLIGHKLAAAFALPNWTVVTVRLKATGKIWLWSTPGLPLLAIAALRNASRPLWLLAASALLTYGVYWFVPFDQGHGWGYRYFHTAWGVLPLLGAAFLVRSHGGITESATAVADPGTRITAASAWWGWAGGLALASLVFANVLRLAQVHTIIGAHLAQVIAVPERGRWIRFVTPNRGMYTWDRIQNLPGESRMLTLMSFGAEADRAWMAQRFPSAQRSLSDNRGSLWALPP